MFPKFFIPFAISASALISASPSSGDAGESTPSQVLSQFEEQKAPAEGRDAVVAPLATIDLERVADYKASLDAYTGTLQADVTALVSEEEANEPPSVPATNHPKRVLFAAPITLYPNAAAAARIGTPERSYHPLFWSSVAALAMGSAADAFTTVAVLRQPGFRELNPLGENGTLAAKTAWLPVAIILERWGGAKHPRLRRWLTVLNYGLAGEFGWAAWQNSTLIR